MLLLIVMLLFIAALAVAVRIVESRNAFGFALVVLVALFAGQQVLNRVTARLGLDQQGGLTLLASTQAVADEKKPPSARQKAKKPHRKSLDTAQDAPTTEAGESGSIACQAEPKNEADSLGDSGDIEIGVESGEGQLIIPPRPDWVEAEPIREGEVHVTAVSSGPFEFERECWRELDKQMQQAVADYIDFYLGRVYGENFKASSFVHYDLDYIKTHLMKETYHEVIQASVGPMHQTHARLEFDQAFQKELDGKQSEIRRQWKQMAALGRLMGAALGFGFVLVMLGVVFGYFKLDTATRGYYTGRLQFIAAVLILIAIVASVVLARQIPWL